MQFNFLAGLEKQTQNPVQKFQIFEAELGFERAKVKVPLQNATLFEEEANKVQPKSITSLERIAKKFGGSLE
jgi:flagellar motor protein MotB